MKEKIDNYKFELELNKKGIKLIAGVDEVGRGPLIGPVVAAAVILPVNFKLDGLTDSKKLSEKKRELQILKDRFLIGKTQMEIANELGISQAQISRIEKSAINNIKKLIK